MPSLSVSGGAEAGEVTEVAVDGYSAGEVFGGKSLSCVGFTYDDIILLPGHIDFGVEEVQLTTRFTKKIALSVPFVSSPMDTVTESGMAIMMALHGGLGVVHYNMTEEEQCGEVRKVKKYRNGFITDPFCLPPDAMVESVQQVKDQHGFSGIPITADGKLGSKLVGIVTNRDIDFVEDPGTTPVRDIMTLSADLVTAKDGVTLAEVRARGLRSFFRGCKISPCTLACVHSFLFIRLTD